MASETENLTQGWIEEGHIGFPVEIDVILHCHSEINNFFSLKGGQDENIRCVGKGFDHGNGFVIRSWSGSSFKGSGIVGICGDSITVDGGI